MRPARLAAALVLGLALALGARAGDEPAWTCFEGPTAMSGGYRIVAYAKASRPGEPLLFFGVAQEPERDPIATFVALVPASGAAVATSSRAESSASCDLAAATADVKLSFGGRSIQLAVRCPVDRKENRFASRSVTVDGREAKEGERVFVLGAEATRAVVVRLPALPPYNDRDARGFVEACAKKLTAVLREVPELKKLYDR